MAGIVWFRQQLLPNLVAKGNFGTGKREILNYNVESQAKGDDHFTSSTLFVHLQLEVSSQSIKTYDLLVKIAPKDAHFREYMNAEMLFCNEIFMYTNIVPAVQEFLSNRRKVSLDLFPKYYYSEPKIGNEILVIEDLRPLGYKMAEERVILDHDHCLVMLKALGRFHAVSYAMKKKSPAVFTSLASSLQDTLFGDNDFYVITLKHTVDYLEKNKVLDEETMERFKERIQEPLKLITGLLKPKEPLAVMCHGDFCRNNVLFKYDGGKPCGIKFFDFQMMRYASPAIDLTFFCFLNTTSEFRVKYWPQLLEEYHKSLLQTLAEILDTPVADLQSEYPLEVFRSEFRDYAFYGFIVCNFFLPEMMVEAEGQVDHDAMSRRSFAECAQAYIEMRGEDTTAAVADIVKDLVSMGAF